MTFGEKVKAERTKLGLNQDELAAKIGVTRRVICSYENDKSRPRGLDRYKKLAEALNLNINYLLFGKLNAASSVRLKQVFQSVIQWYEAHSFGHFRQAILCGKTIMQIILHDGF